MCSKANMFCHNCPYYYFLFFDGQNKAIFDCLKGNDIDVAKNTGKCKNKVEN